MLASLLGGEKMDYIDLANQLLDLRSRVPQIKMERTISEMGRGEVLVMNYLSSRKNKVYPKDISKALMLTTARIAAILKNLEKHDMITRTQDSLDNRQTVVELTDTGLASISIRREKVVQTTAKMLEALGEEDAKAYIRIQKKLMNLEEVWK